jgi:hypothetical protein
MQDTVDRLRSLSRYVRAFNRVPNLLKPRRFTEWLLRKRVCCNPDDRWLVTTADKWAVREYVQQTVGERLLTAVQCVTARPEDIDFERLRYPLVLKSTHGTGHVQIIHEKTAAVRDRLVPLLNDWLRQSFPLWYRRIPPKIIIEEFLQSRATDCAEGITSAPADYKVFVISGKPVCVVVDIDRFHGHKRALFTPDWNQLDVQYRWPMALGIPRPANLGRMLEAATKLAGRADFVRIDLYDLGDRVVFGEITHSPDAAIMHFSPDEFDYWLGSIWAGGNGSWPTIER